MSSSAEGFAAVGASFVGLHAAYCVGRPGVAACAVAALVAVSAATLRLAAPL
jgi:hypothetical protein